MSCRLVLPRVPRHVQSHGLNGSSAATGMQLLVAEWARNIALLLIYINLASRASHVTIPPLVCVR